MPHKPPPSRFHNEATLYARLGHPLRVETAHGRHSTWVRLHGELDLVTAADVEAAIVSAAALTRRVTVDLRGLDFIDSNGVALLVRADSRARRHGATLTVVAGAGPVTQLLHMCRLDRQIALIDGAAF